MTFTRRRLAVALAMAIPALMSCGGGGGDHSSAWSPPAQPVPGDSVLHGDLIVIASGNLAKSGRTKREGSFAVSRLDHSEANGLGNATLTAPGPLALFDQFAAEVAALGIRRVTGNVIVDDRRFEHFDLREWFKVTPMFVNDGVVDLRPTSQAFTVESSVIQTALDRKLGIELESAQGRRRISVVLPAGDVPTLGGYPLVRTFRIMDPLNYALRLHRCPGAQPCRRPASGFPVFRQHADRRTRVSSVPRPDALRRGSLHERSGPERHMRRRRARPRRFLPSICSPTRRATARVPMRRTGSIWHRRGI